MAYIIALEDASGENKNIGVKAARLGEMIRAGLPVPTGFVITSDAFELFLRANRIEERIKEIDEVSIENTDELNKRSRELEELIITREIPDTIRREIRDSYENVGVGKEARLLGGAALDIIRAGRERVFAAVRTSVIIEDPTKTSFAGQTRSYLNISGIDRLLEAVKRCWASLFTPRAIFYRKNNNIGGSLLSGVVVQKMLEPEKSGILFTADPLTADKSKIIIEASYGLGQSVASGLIIPDIYRVDKNTSQITGKNPGKKSMLFRKDQIGKTVIESVGPERAGAHALLDPEILKLADISKRIEALYGGQPQDIEWCIERGRVFVVQARPLTALQENLQSELPENRGVPILTGYAASRGFCKGSAKIINNTEQLSKISGDNLLVAKTMNTDFVQYIRKFCGIVTDEGGITSHFATMARESGKPFITGSEKATQVLADGQELLMDGFSGNLYRPDQPRAGADAALVNPAPTEISADLTATEMSINLSLPEDVERIPVLADSISPLSIEHMIAQTGKNPLHMAKTNPHELVSTIIEKIGGVAAKANHKPVWYKCLELGAEEFQNAEGSEETKETNPLLGRKGIRASLSNQDVLKCELKALRLLKENGFSNLGILLPFVTNRSEIDSIKNLADSPLKIGVIAESPAAILDIDGIAGSGIHLFLIDLNSIAQLTLGVDRSNPLISDLYSETHPSVLNILKQAIVSCRRLGIKCGIFGDGISSSAGLIEKLVEWGIDSVSIDPSAIQDARTQVIRAERKLLLGKIREQNNTETFIKSKEAL